MLFLKEPFVSDKEDVHTFLLRLPEDLFRRIQRYARASHRSVNNQIVALLEERLPPDQHEHQPKPPR